MRPLLIRPRPIWITLIYSTLPVVFTVPGVTLAHKDFGLPVAQVEQIEIQPKENSNDPAESHLHPLCVLNLTVYHRVRVDLLCLCTN